MNKKSRIGLIIVIALILVAINIGLASARSITSSACNLQWQVWLNDGEPGFWVIPGEVEWALDGSILTKTCTGNIPLGEPVGKSGFIIFDLEDMQEYLGVDIGNPFVIGPEETGGTQLTMNDQGDDITSFDWFLTVKPNGNYEYQAFFKIE